MTGWRWWLFVRLGKSLGLRVGATGFTGETPQPCLVVFTSHDHYTLDAVRVLAESYAGLHNAAHRSEARGPRAWTH